MQSKQPAGSESTTAIVYEAVSKAVKHIRTSTPLPSGWSEEIDKDYKSRK